MTWTPTTALRAGASVAVLASGALLLAACSSGSSGTPAAGAKASSSVSASASASGSMTAYRDCLSQHGVQMPSFAPRTGRPSGQPSGRPSGGGGFGGGFGGASADPKTQAAMKACEALRPQFSGRGADGGAGGADASALQAFTSCLKDHGVTLSTASPSAGSTARPRGGMLGNLDTADPKTAAAYATCKPLLPQRPTPAAS